MSYSTEFLNNFRNECRESQIRELYAFITSDRYNPETASNMAMQICIFWNMSEDELKTRLKNMLFEDC